MRMASWKTPCYINIHYKMYQVYYVDCLKTIQELRSSFRLRLFTGPARVWTIILVKGLHIHLIFLEYLDILNSFKIYFKIKKGAAFIILIPQLTVRVPHYHGARRRTILKQWNYLKTFRQNYPGIMFAGSYRDKTFEAKLSWWIYLDATVLYADFTHAMEEI